MASRAPSGARKGGEGRARPVLLTVAVLAYLAAALRPFEFDLPRYFGDNRLLRLPGGAVRLAEPSTGRTPPGPAILDAAIDEGAFTIVLELLPRSTAQGGPAAILTISRDRYRTNLIVGQDGADLVLGARGPARRPERARWFRVEDVFASHGWRTVRLEARSDRLTTSVDGHRRLVTSLRPHGFGAWDADARIVLGRDGSDGPGWEGDVRRATMQVGARSVDYLAPGALRVPGSWWHLPAKPSRGDRRQAATDVVLNVVGFAPFGLLVGTVARWRRPILGAAAACAVLSGVMELGQVIVVPRDPSVLDVAMNVLGGVAGASLARRWLDRWRRETRLFGRYAAQVSVRRRGQQ